MVYWITGLSGAGKTTIGKLFFDKLKERRINSVFLDGDTLRKTFADEFGYSETERRKCAMRYSKVCKLLDDQNINVVICTISMFDEIRNMNREAIKNYREIYIKVPISVLKERDQKGLYSRTSQEQDVTIAGIDFQFEEPKNPDFVLRNDGSKSPDELSHILVERFL